MSISPSDKLEFVGDRLRFEKSLPRWRIVGREEIEEMEKGSTEIGRQRSMTAHCSRPGYAPGRPPGRSVEKVGRPPGRPVEKTGRPPSRPVCTTCTGLARSTVAWNGRPPGRLTESRLLSVWVRLTARSTVDMSRSTGRSTDRRVLAFLSGFRFLFWLDSIGVSLNLGTLCYK